MLTKEFLDFTASRGNNLRSIGLEPGCKWCLCTARWKEAMEAAKGADDPVVPRYGSSLLLHPIVLENFVLKAASSPEYTYMLQTNQPFRMALRWMH